MEDVLVPCEGCGRHHRSTEAACPFCDRPATPRGTSAPPARSERLSRAAMILLGAASLAACDRVKDNSSGTVVQPYGAPYIPEDAAAPVVTLYGAPPTPNVSDAGEPPAPPAPPDARERMKKK